MYERNVLFIEEKHFDMDMGIMKLLDHEERKARLLGYPKKELARYPTS